MAWHLAATLAAVGAATFAASAWVAARSGVSPREQVAFRAVNQLPGWLLWVLWIPMQAGNLVVGALVGLTVSWVLGSWQSGVATVVAVGGKLVVERIVRHRMQPLVQARQRPGSSVPGAILRGRDVPATGPSFPSGHVILVAALACVVAAESTGPWALVPWAFVLLVAIGRVYVGAHNPLDVTAGLGLGLVLGGVAALVLL